MNKKNIKKMLWMEISGILCDLDWNDKVEDIGQKINDEGIYTHEFMINGILFEIKMIDKLD